MTRQLHSVIDGFVFRHFFIALCAAAMVFSTFILNGLPIAFSPFTIFLVAATFLIYNFHAHSFFLDYSSLNKFIASFKKLNISFSFLLLYFIALFIALFETTFFEKELMLFLIPLTIMTLLYSIPAWGLKNKVRIRESFFVKLPVIGLVWSLTTVIIPLVEQNIALSSPFVIKQIVCRFLFVFALCVPFEIRDLEVDQSQNVKTLPSVLGITATKLLGVFMLLLEMFLHHTMEIPLALMVALDLSSIFALLWIVVLKNKMGTYFYKLFVDGTMVLRFVFIYLASTFL
jgi:hypothetical protein